MRQNVLFFSAKCFNLFILCKLFWKMLKGFFPVCFKKIQYSLCLDVNNFEIFQLCGLITSEPFGGKKSKISPKNPKFIRDSVKQIKKYGYRAKNRSYLRFVRQSQDF
jgi:hypothetical protein